MIKSVLVDDVWRLNAIDNFSKTTYEEINTIVSKMVSKHFNI